MKKNINIIFIIITGISIAWIIFQFQSSIINFKKTISDESVEIIENIEDKIYIKIYLDGKLSEGLKGLQTKCIELIEELNQYSTHKIEYVLINPSESENKEKNEGYYLQLLESGMNPIWVKNETDTNIYFPAATISYRENSLNTQLFNNESFYDTIDATLDEVESSIQNLEYNIISTIYKITNKRKTIAFIQGNGELDSNGVHSISNTINEFYDVEHFDITKFTDSINANSVQEKINSMKKYTAIIIAKPTITFQNTDLLLLDQYLMNGGKILWVVDGTNSHLNNFDGTYSFPIQNNNLNLNNLFSSYGFKVNSDLIQDKNCRYIPLETPKGIQYYKWPYHLKIFNKNKHTITLGIDTVVSEFTSSITLTDSNISSTSLLYSSTESHLDLEGQYVELSVINNGINEQKFQNQNHIISAVLEGVFKSPFNSNVIQLKKESPETKMIIISDGDIIENRIKAPNFLFELGFDPLERKIFNGNTNFILNSVQYLCGDENLIKIKNESK